MRIPGLINAHYRIAYNLLEPITELLRPIPSPVYARTLGLRTQHVVPADRSAAAALPRTMIGATKH